MTLYFKLSQKLNELLQSRKSRLDLSQIEKVYKSLNLKKYPMVHIAGTNGKGSCTVKISAALTSSGLKCGSYTSPHISTFRERISIDGEMISKEEIEEYLPYIFNLEQNLTFFEIMTLLAFFYFSRKEVDVAVIEVGLGGRLDATNCIHPILSIISSISFDHQHILGYTLEEIAAEKSGIIKRGVPVVLGPSSRQASLFKKVKEMEAPLLLVDGSFENYDLENQAISRTSLNELKKHLPLLENAIEKGLLEKPPCRFEKVYFDQREIILDISHNAAGLCYLFKHLEIEYPKRKKILFFSMSQGHDHAVCCKIVELYADELYILNSPHPRLAKEGELQIHFKSFVPVLPIGAVLKMILNSEAHSLFICTGSAFIMAPIRQQLGFQDQEDQHIYADGSFNFSGLKAN